MILTPVSDAGLSAAADRLPMAGRVLVELSRLLNNPLAATNEVIAIVRQDPTLVAQIIRISNSAAYAPAEPVGSLERAIGFVGFAEVHRLVGVVAVRQLTAQRFSLYPLGAEMLRVQTLFVAVLMEEMARWAAERPHTCYTIGMLRTIGMLVLERIPPAVPATAFLKSGETHLDDWERNLWGISNPEVAERVLAHWKMPAETVSAIRHHYRPLGRHNPKTHLLALACGAAADRFYGIPGEEKYWLPCPENFEKAGFDPEDFPVICEKAKRNFQRLNLVVG